MKRGTALRMVSSWLTALCWLTPPPVPARDGTAAAPMVMGSAPGQLGSVSFVNSCSPQVQADFTRGVALLHSFALAEAQQAFEKVAAADPQCALAYWGEAMVRFPQLNGWPDEAAAKAAEAALAKGDAAAERSAREARYLQAMHAFYDGYAPTQDGESSHARRYADAMAALAAAYPHDLEAQVFHALAILAAEPPDDTQLAGPKQAVAILLPLFKAHPDHPGIAHYIIHACDNPQMAPQGLQAARRYAAIAPASGCYSAAD